MDALPFLANSKSALGSLYIVHGDETFLKRQVIRSIRKLALGDDDTDEQAVSIHAGDKALFADVFDELDTVPFFYPKRVVIVENADPFVTKYRADLETKLTHLPATGVLIIDAKTWLATTRLAKLTVANSIACKAPTSQAIGKWCSTWCEKQYQKQLPISAAELLIDHVGPDMGLLDQELLKLSIYVGVRGKIDTGDVDKLVGNSRAENIWKIFDAISSGNTKEGLAILHRLFDQGEEPMRILGAFAAQLRKLAQATRLTTPGKSSAAALAEVGVSPYFSRGAEQQLHHLGRRRLDRLYDWLLQINLDLRGNSPLPPRILFERFLLKLARKNESVP